MGWDIYLVENGFPDEIVNTILSNINTFSSGLIKKEYVEELLIENNCDILITLYDEDGSLRGFACISEYISLDNIDYCVLDLLCCAKKHSMNRRSNKYIPNGKNLLDKLENLMKWKNNKFIKLNSISSAILYYHKNGYKFNSNKYQECRLKENLEKINDCYKKSKNYIEMEELIDKLSFLNRYIENYNNIQNIASKQLWDDVDENSNTLTTYRENKADRGYSMKKNL